MNISYHTNHSIPINQSISSRQHKMIVKFLKRTQLREWLVSFVSNISTYRHIDISKPIISYVNLSIYIKMTHTGCDFIGFSERFEKDGREHDSQTDELREDWCHYGLLVVWCSRVEGEFRSKYLILCVNLFCFVGFPHFSDCIDFPFSEAFNCSAFKEISGCCLIWGDHTAKRLTHSLQ